MSGSVTVGMLLGDEFSRTRDQPDSRGRAASLVLRRGTWVLM